jgi:hypothetical protein
MFQNLKLLRRDRVALPGGKRNWPAIRAAARRAVRRFLARKAA